MAKFIVLKDKDSRNAIFNVDSILAIRQESDGSYTVWQEGLVVPVRETKSQILTAFANAIE